MNVSIDQFWSHARCTFAIFYGTLNGKMTCFCVCSHSNHLVNIRTAALLMVFLICCVLLSRHVVVAFIEYYLALTICASSTISYLIAKRYILMNQMSFLVIIPVELFLAYEMHGTLCGSQVEIILFVNNPSIWISKNLYLHPFIPIWNLQIAIHSISYLTFYWLLCVSILYYFIGLLVSLITM